MSDPFSGRLSKRERQILEALYVLRRGTVTDVRAAIANPPSYSAVRTTMNILVAKGFLSFTPVGRSYTYFPVVSHEKARQSAVRHLLQTYFDGSVREAVVGLISADGSGLSEADYRELISLIRKARQGGGRKGR